MQVYLIGEGGLSVVKPAWLRIAPVWFAETSPADQSERGWNQQRHSRYRSRQRLTNLCSMAVVLSHWMGSAAARNLRRPQRFVR
jgi:hypothetical protein